MRKLILVWIALAFPWQLNGQTHWIKHPDNPIFLPGAAGAWDEMGVTLGSVLFHNNSYHMWYNNLDFDLVPKPGLASLGYATSGDGIHWTRYHGNPVLVPGPVGSWDENIVAYPRVVLRNGLFHMWYMGHSGKSFSQDARLGYATSTDGVNWTKYKNNPVLSEGALDSWDEEWVSKASVVFIDTVFHMWYMGNKGPDVLTGHATSPDGVAWTKDALNPVLTAGSWDYPRCEPGPVFYDGITFHMWYDGGPYLRWKGGYARSRDGSNWVKYPGNPVFYSGPPGDWDANYIEISAVLYDSTEGKFRMWYSANSEDGKESVGYAESYEPDWHWLGTHLGGPSCLVDSAIYVFNCEGSGSWTISPDAHAYNTVTDRWTKLTSMPAATTGGSLGQIGDKIYLVGGWQNQDQNSWETVNSIMEYDLVADSWRYLKASPVKMGSTISCVKEDLFYLFGGLQQNDAGSGNLPRSFHGWTFDPIREIWDTTSLPKMTFPHVMHGSAQVVDGDIYVLSGVGPGPEFEIQPSERFDGETWETIAAMPVPVVLHTSIVHDHKILVFGGDSVWSPSLSYSTNLIQEYDPASDSWRLMEPMPFQRSGMAGEKLGDYIYLIGGYTQDREPSTAVSEMWKFNLDSLNQWEVSCSEVLLSQDTLALKVDSTYTLTASVQPTYVADHMVTWSSDNEPVASVTSDGTVTAKAAGVATITASANAGGCKASCQVAIQPGVGIAPDKAERIRIFPNPVEDQVTIQADFQGTKLLEITTLNGQIVYSEQMGGSTHQIDLSFYPKGVYFLTISSEDFNTTRKIIRLK